MVSCISKGRYGNFCFANMAAYVYSLKHGLDFHIQDTSIAPHLWPLYHQDLKNRNWNPELETVYVNDNQHSYRELEFKEEWRDKNIIIGTTGINTGYFQSYRYLKGYEDEIRIKFGLPVDFLHNTVGIHIRRTDFLQLADKHPVITKKYLNDAINFFLLRLGKTYFVIYTDDIDWVIKYIEERNDSDSFMAISNTVEKDFKGMIECEHFITSNSSLSVLASILNPNPNKIIICPKHFFGEGNKHLDTSTLYPHGWIKYEY